MKKHSPLAALALLALAGCVSTATYGVVNIGSDLYMIGSATDSYVNGQTKAQQFEQASKFCADRTRVMQPVDQTSLDHKVDASRNAELKFYCLLDSDPRLNK